MDISEPKVRRLEPSDSERWETFVSTQPAGNIYHTLAWRDVVSEVFGHTPVYLLCETGKEITAVLPMFMVSFPGLGRKLISMPYELGSGGALTNNQASEQALVDAAVDLAKQAGARFLELRSELSRSILNESEFQMAQPVVMTSMPLNGMEAVRSRIKKDHRDSIRVAKKRGVVVSEATSPEDYRTFYRVYLEVFRNFGTPPYGFSFFQALWQHLHPTRSVRLLLAHAEGQCIGGLLLMAHNQRLVIKFAECVPSAVKLRTYGAMYWGAIELGLGEDYTHLSFGTSHISRPGLIEYKERWGAQSEPVSIYSLPITKPVPSLDAYYDSSGLIRRIWRHVPLPITAILGNPLNRWFC